MKECGSCSLCCKVIAVEELDKPACSWCNFAKKGGGCSIYADRPEQCSGFTCAWLEAPELPDEWKPSRCKFVVRADGNDGTMAIDVDPGYPTAWRDPRFYGQIKMWSRAAWTGEGRVFVYVDAVGYAIFPEEDISIGHFAPGEVIATGYRRGLNWRQPFAAFVSTGREIVGNRYAL